MCGICGSFSLAPRGRVTKTAIIKMREQLVHRGPDDAGVYLSPDHRLGLGFRRLAIVDLSPNGHQPMTNEDETIWIVFNGEIYNHQELRQHLIKSGHQFRSKSDTEVIIHAYEQWGTDCLQRFRGMFSFAIWDNNKKQLFFARDRLGIKPFYYTTHNQQFYFASEIKAILVNSQIPRAMDEEAFFHYLTFFVAPAPKTLFQGIYKLPPGHFGVIADTGQLTITEYWDAIQPPDHRPSTTAWQKEILTKLTESVKLRMMSDVPFGAYLSGGIDSSVITVLMNQHMARPIDTFSVGFRSDQEFNELEYARQICDQYGANYHQTLIDRSDLKTFFDQLIYHQDEPIADWVCFPLYYVSKLIRDNKVIVAQVGEGSDELFCGYEGYMQFLQAEKLVNRFRALPKPGRWLLYQLAKLFYTVKKIPLVPEVFRRIYQNEEFFWGGAIAFNEFEKQRLLSPKLRGRYRSHDVVKAIYAKFDAQQPKADFLARMTYLELKNRLAELLLMRVDKISMAVSIEARVPFLDHQFVERILQIPTAVKLSHGPKSILKQSLKGVIPDNIINRPKKGFGAPISKWFKDPSFGRWLMAKIRRSKLLDQELLDRQYIERMYQLHLAGHGDYSVQLWILVNVCGWYDRWIAQPRHD